jgi:transcriptional regulator with PAS, ATPase and Fis domain
MSIAAVAGRRAVRTARRWLEGRTGVWYASSRAIAASSAKAPPWRGVPQSVARGPHRFDRRHYWREWNRQEWVAHAIRNSTRASRPFVAINCAAIPETLLESELFGHERGAFTGAVALKKGRLECAEGGSVFLDEIGELSLALQAKLLRVLQERTFERVGGTKSVAVDFRLIAATNRDLEEAITQGTFRRDLYYRLNVVALAIPPLRERLDDIPLLAHRRHAARARRRVSGITPAALACLSAYDWPGNVRELENAIERAIVLGSTDHVLLEDLPDTVVEAASPAMVAYQAASTRTTVHQAKDLITRVFEGGRELHGGAMLGRIELPAPVDSQSQLEGVAQEA